MEIDASIKTTWVEWMKEQHIPAVMATGTFSRHIFNERIDSLDQNISIYTILYFCENESKLDEYFKKFAKKLQEEHNDRFEGNFTATRSILRSF
ncbi:MAG: DUF4286 family protein [Bacteroidetes bacterium]|nr:DUF4286 family protein [Bacteroidota bacterium]